ncbi:hypothetical protein [Niallia endozanthoxylica]|uniref:Uncharacterized protein n=1 Tax=Niallia endozanthoxylica TaxID=2036016 RepID=A0A5J5HQ57_9BACI|nr:hypothetical protein [Niallia endozanthoxylica]KAA9022950.1 hypothetical protein F4V44_14545 [Niallia endozanthoxylica]
MAILEKEVEITLHNKTIEYYEKLGYEIPRRKNRQNKMVVPRGSKIIVKLEDLQEGSGVFVTKICDDCGSTGKVKYSSIFIYRERGDGRDRCKECGWKYGIPKKDSNYLVKVGSIAETDSHIAPLFYYEEDAFKYTRNSARKVYFKCPTCNRKILKQIGYVTNFGLTCELCDDGFTIPEKFTVKLLEQLGIAFETQKIFEWSGNKRYDFYIEDKNMILETHGMQHYGITFEYLGGRTLEEEQENDRLKFNNAIENGVENYIVIDCQRSEFKYLKNSFLKSEFANSYDLTCIDWEECYKFACSSLMHEAWKMWDNGMTSTSKIAEKLNISRTGATRYLKRGYELGICTYDVEKETNISPVVQLSPIGEFMNEFESISKAMDYLGFSKNNNDCSNISTVCGGKTKTAYGYRWMYKEDYDKYLKGEIELPQYQDTRYETIVKLTFDNELVSEHIGVYDASVSVGLSRSNSHIIDCCNGKRDKSHGFKWMYKKDYIKYLNGEIEMPPFNDTRPKIIVRLTKDNEYISEHEGVLNASISVGFSEVKYQITNCCKRKVKSAYGYKWMYKEDYEVQYGKIK